MKDEFIQRACYKLILYKDRLSQFEIPVFQEYVILISPDIQILLRFDGEAENAPGASTNALGPLHNAMVHRQTPGGDGPGFDEVNEAGGTVTSIASTTSQSYKQGSIGHRKSSSSQPVHDGDAPQPILDGDAEHDGLDQDVNSNKKKKKKKKKHKKKRNKSTENELDEQQQQLAKEHEDQINIPIAAVSKKKKKGKKKKLRSLSMNVSKIASENKTASLSNLSKTIEREKKKKQKKEEKQHKKDSNNKEEKKENEDYLDMDLDEMVSSDSSSSSSDDYLLLSDSDHNNENNGNAANYEYRLDANGKYIEVDKDGITNNLANYVELKLVKYPGTGELYVVVTKFDDKKDAMEVFRIDFAKCINIEKNEIEQDFSIYFEAIALVFRADDYEKARQILITLRQFFEQHCTNIQPELPPPPESIVTDQMTLFFGD